MRTTMCVGVALACCAGTVAAQGQDVDATGFTLSIEYADPGIVVGQTTTATLIASWTGSSTSYLSSVNINLIANEELVSVDTTPDLSSWAMPALGWNGTESFADGSSIRNIEGAQSSLFGAHQTGNPFIVGTFTVTGTAAGLLVYSATLADQAPFAFTVSDSSLPSANPAQFGVSSLQLNGLLIVPSAPGFGVLAVAGLMATRRRRA